MSWDIPTLKEIRRVSRDTAAALEDLGIKSCIFGSAACAMFGLQRVPNDVDIVALTNDMDVEEIKQGIVSQNAKFFLVRSSRRGATYQILHYRLFTPYHSDEDRTCKVDILLPKSDLDIPKIPLGRIVYTRIPGVPVMPLLAVLLLKLQGWTDHRESPRRDFQAKQYVDVEDIKEMLEIAVQDDIELRTEKWMPQWFLRLARPRIEEFVENFPETEDDWSEIGFNV